MKKPRFYIEKAQDLLDDGLDMMDFAVAAARRGEAAKGKAERNFQKALAGLWISLSQTLFLGSRACGEMARNVIELEMLEKDEEKDV